MNVLVTGGAGFIGSNFIRWLLENEQNVSVINLDALTYAGNLENLRDVEGNLRYTFIKGDVTDAALLKDVFYDHCPNVVVNFAAESHVDRSITDARSFVRTNIIGAQALLDVSREHKVQRFCQVSTDEVYGSLEPTDPPFTETTSLHPNSPYAASKASADLLALSAFRTHKVPVVISRASNNYGPYQFPEKLIPLLITNALDDKLLPLYGDGLNVRDWLHVEDHCAGVWAVANKGRPGEVYNLGGNCELTNAEVVRRVLEELHKPDTLVRHVKDRLGHDRRYALNSDRTRHELKWVPKHHFELGLRETIAWYREHRDWWESVKSGEYKSYYTSQYDNLK
jgi:dTDP-glucose 4,6-dehydratase